MSTHDDEQREREAIEAVGVEIDSVLSEMLYARKLTPNIAPLVMVNGVRFPGGLEQFERYREHKRTDPTMTPAKFVEFETSEQQKGK